DYLSGKFALNLARANGDTGVIIGVEGGTMPDDGQMEQIRNQLRLKQEKSRRGEFASVFVPANLKIEDPKVRMPDAEFTAQRLENRHEIYVAFGLPPSMADVVQSYSVGSASDRYRAIEEASMPTARKIAEPISVIASMMAGMEIEARFDWPEHPVLQTVRNEKLDAGVKLVNLGMPWKVASDYLHLDLPRFLGDEQGYLPATLLPVGPEPPPAPEEDSAFGEERDHSSDNTLKAIKALRSEVRGQRSEVGKGSGCDCSLDDEQMSKDRSEKEIKLWRSIVAGRREFIRAFASKFNRVLMEARSEVLNKLARAEKSSSSSLHTKHVAADFTFDVAKFSDHLIASMRAVSLDVLQKSGNQVMNELGKDDGPSGSGSWQMPPAQTLKFFMDRKNKLVAVAEEISDRVRNRISGGLQNGDSLHEIAAAVRTEFNDISSGRAHHVASTETAAACGVGRHQALRDAGVQYKRWLASGNANVRSAHSAINNVKAPMDEPFKVMNPDGETDEIMHPGDPDGEPWNVVNCHCVELAAAPDEDDESSH
ncbi:MAG TPA: phage minor head protein, partial [Verrucomicrobiae bacterium]